MVDTNTLFGGLLTTLGAAKKTNCDALGIPWEPKFMLIGDGGGVDPAPDPAQTRLVNQVYRAQLNQLYVSPTDNNVLIAELVLPPDIGGWWIRELALEDKDGVFSAVASAAPSYKPLLAQGSGRNQVVRMHIITSGTSNIQLKIDPSVVLATRAYADSLTVRAGQAEAEAGTENSKIMTPLRVFQAIAKVVVQATETAFGWAKVATQAQVTTGTDDTAFLTPKKLRGAQATQAEAEAGTDNAKGMTPLRVFQAIAKVVVQATETAFGWAKVATQAQVTTGTDDTAFLTPKKLRAAQATQADAETGTDNTKVMTPQRVFQAVATPKRIAVFTSSGSWVCPVGVTEILVDGCGGGAGGAGANGSTNAGEGGGAGHWVIDRWLAVVPGQTYAITIASAGIGGALNADGTAGGATSFGALLTMAGGVQGSKNGVGAGNGGGWGQAGGDAFALGGVGGGGFFGVGGSPRIGQGAGGVGYGSGGAGGAPGYAGGSGAAGFLKIRW